MSDSRLLDCNAPGFIKRFFTTSRLHHLSTWKADIADFVMGQMSVKSRSTAASGHRSSNISEPFRTIMHVDMDCFFASVGIRDRPHLEGKPVAVAHSQGGVSLDYSTSEIASCNYEARAKGVKNGIFIGSAKELAPDLVIIPYEFDQYDACSKILYRTLISNSDFVQSVSCDEAFVDVTFCIQKRLMEATRARSVGDLQLLAERDSSFCQLYKDLSTQLAEEMRAEIFQQTRCHASVGIANNILLARIATSKAKPNGVHSLLQREKALLHLQDLPIRGLPGVGRSTSDKCAQMQFNTCGDVQSGGDGNSGVIAQLCRELGEKTGEGLHDFCWGRDDRVLENKPRQSVGSDINWGIRFTNAGQVDVFLKEYCAEVYARLDRTMHTAGHVTVNLKKKLYEGEPGKFLGCGHCLDLSRSMVPGRAIASAEALHRCVSMLYKEMGLQPLDVRGVGIHLKKLQQRQAGSGSSALFKSVPSANSNASTSGGSANVLQDFLFHGKHEVSAVERECEVEAVVAKGQVTANIRNYFHGNSLKACEGGVTHPEVRTVDNKSALCENSVDLVELEHAELAASSRMQATFDDEEVIVIASKSVLDTGTQDSQSSEESAVPECVSPTPARDETTPDLAPSLNHATVNETPSTHVVAVSQAVPVLVPVRGSAPAAAESALSMEDVDLDVFLALPEDIQRELQRAFNSSNSRPSVPPASTLQNAVGPSSPPRKRAKIAQKSGKTAKIVANKNKSSSSQPSITSIWGINKQL